MSKEVEPTFHLEPKHIKNTLVMNYSTGTENIDIVAWADTVEDVKELFDHSLESYMKVRKK